jgi:peptidoglycan/xylan/chitin deacetylase (PgdA/CDA1 family)
MMPAKSFTFLMSLFLLVATPVVQAQPQALVPTFTQQLVITPASTSTDTPAKLDILPVYDGKTWAFTARWDDNNTNHLNMQKAMASLGLKGTFYLNASSGNTAADYAKQLSTDGCSIGGHTTHHYWLPTLNTNAIFREILLNRIEREADTDLPINSFAFPFGSYRSSLDASAMVHITNALIRSGYHHCVYSGFVRSNPSIPDGLFSTVNQVVPGDRQINADKFRQAVKRILDDPAKYQQTDYSISLGVHCWQSAEELEKFKVLLADYAHRDDFWYCTETEFAAYRLQAKNTQINPVNNKQGTYTIIRPTSVVTGNAIPLSIVITASKPAKVTLDGQTLEPVANGEGRWLVNLPYPASQALPQKIDWVQNNDPQTPKVESVKFPGLGFALLNVKNNLSLTIDNSTDKLLKDVRVNFRMPLACEPGIGQNDFSHLEPGKTAKVAALSYKLHDEPEYVEGSEFYVAQVDFMLDGQPGRVYVTQDGTPDYIDQPTLRDATYVMGPLSEEALNWDVLAAESVPGTTRVALNDTPLGKWFTAQKEDRELLGYNRFVQYNRDEDWKKLAGAYSRKPALLAASLDFAITQDCELSIRSDSSIKQIAIDGQTFALSDNKTPSLKAGNHRVVVLVDTKGRSVFYKPNPVLLKITAGDQEVQYLKAN